MTMTGHCCIQFSFIKNCTKPQYKVISRRLTLRDSTIPHNIVGSGTKQVKCLYSIKPGMKLALAVTLFIDKLTLASECFL